MTRHIKKMFATDYLTTCLYQLCQNTNIQFYTHTKITHKLTVKTLRRILTHNNTPPFTLTVHKIHQ